MLSHFALASLMWQAEFCHRPANNRQYVEVLIWACRLLIFTLVWVVFGESQFLFVVFFSLTEMWRSGKCWYVVVALLMTGHCQIISPYSNLLYVGMAMMNILEYSSVQQFVLHPLSSDFFHCVYFDPLLSRFVILYSIIMHVLNMILSKKVRPRVTPHGLPIWQLAWFFDWSVYWVICLL